MRHRHDKSNMPPYVGNIVQGPDGRLGRCRLGYFANSPDAGHFEIEYVDGPPGLVLWEDVIIPSWEVRKSADVPAARKMYSSRYGKGGVLHPGGFRDRRYTVGMELCGYDDERAVARFQGEWIGAYETVSEAWQAARSHQKGRWA